MACVNCKEKKLKVGRGPSFTLRCIVLTERASSVTTTYLAVKIVAAQRSVSTVLPPYSIGPWSLLASLTDDAR